MTIPFRAFKEEAWQWIAATYSQADGVARTFQDGELVREMKVAGPLLHSGDLFIGGATVAGDDGGFRGVVAEVRIYNRALTEAEIRALAAREPGR